MGGFHYALPIESPYFKPLSGIAQLAYWCWCGSQNTSKTIQKCLPGAKQAPTL